LTEDIKKRLFAKIYDEWVQAIFNFLFYRCGNRAVAEDYTQEVFIKYWDKMDKVDAGKEKSYLFTIAKNIIINQIAHKQVVIKFEQNFNTHTKPDNPEFILEMKEFDVKLQNAIGGLTEGEREVFLMNRIDGYKYREIAELLAISQKAVEKRMHKALIKLRKVVEKI
jgi:RNA polymerase sigma-70 factor (ECF subfamily)